MKLSKTLSHLSIASTLAVSTLAISAPLDQDQKKHVQKIVHEYIVENPEVLVEASQALQQKEANNMGKKAKTAIAANAKALFANKSDPVIGNAKGNITIVEFFDYQCKHCKDMQHAIKAIVHKNPEVRVVIKELPILGAHSKEATAAALAANLQGPDKYLKLHEALFAIPNPLNKDKVLAAAKTAGLDVAKLEKDMKSAEIQRQVDSNLKVAEAIGLVGTPSFVIGKWEVDGSNNTGAEAIFIPGVLNEAGLQELVNQIKKK